MDAGQFHSVKLQFSLNCINFLHISAIFLRSNDNILKFHDSIQQKKCNKLLRECKPEQDPEKPTYSDYLINFELFYRSINN